MKKLLLLGLISMGFINQSFSQKVYHSLKYGFYTEVMIGPTSVISSDTYTEFNSQTGQNETVTTYYHDYGYSISLVNVSYTFRYNALETSDNFGLGINAAPSLGVGVGGDGIGNINLPAYLSANFGAGSTYNTSSNFGGYVGVGYEYNKIGLLGDNIAYKTGWSQPVVIGGIRWWNKKNRLNELSFKYGFGSNGDLPASVEKEISNDPKPQSFQLNWGWFINY